MFAAEAFYKPTLKPSETAKLDKIQIQDISKCPKMNLAESV